MLGKFVLAGRFASALGSLEGFIACVYVLLEEVCILLTKELRRDTHKLWDQIYGALCLFRYRCASVHPRSILLFYEGLWSM